MRGECEAERTPLCVDAVHLEDTDGDEQPEDGALALRASRTRGERERKLLLRLCVVAVAERGKPREVSERHLL